MGAGCDGGCDGGASAWRAAADIDNGAGIDDDTAGILGPSAEVE